MRIWKRHHFWSRLAIMAICTMILAVFGTKMVFAQDAEVTAPSMDDIANLKISIDTAWVFVAGFLVFLMQLGFAILETGMIQQTSAVNALLENFTEAGISAIFWWICGFGIAFGASSGGLFGTTLFMPGLEAANTPFVGNISVLTMFFFQFAFAATASTITTGAMAERTDFIGHLIYNVLIVALIYPVVVHWIWGGGWLFQQGFFDFAGGTVVHTVGAVICLIGAKMLGPRKGKIWGKPLTAHNLGLALIGTLILWFGWYGFNPGSTLGITGGAASTVGIVVLNTSLGAGAGMLSSMIFQYFRTGKWDLIATMNGTLAGLVIVTPGCAFISPLAALILGLVGGVLVLLVTDLIEKLKIDDAVGAFAVHGGGGIVGTLAIGLFAEPTLTPFAANIKAGFGGLLIPGGSADILITQIIGVAAVVLWCTVTSVLMFSVLKAVGHLRVNPKAETDGNFIDAYEHGQTIWPDILPLPEDVPAGKTVPATAVGD